MKQSVSLGLDKQGVQKVLRKREYFGDGISQLALNTMTGLVSMITYFYTDKIGLAAATAGTIIFTAKILDAFTDLAMGSIVDRTKSKYGKARPWFLWMSVPVFIAIVALFMMPSNASVGFKTGYGYVSNIFATAIVYTAVAIPYGSLMATVTRSVEERSKMGITRAFMGYLSGMVIAIGIVPITNALGGDQRAWIIFASIFGVLSFASVLITFFTTKERFLDLPIVDDKGKVIEKDSFKRAIKLLAQNKYWWIMILANTLVFVVYGLGAGSGIYYVKYVLGNENLLALLGGIGLLPVFIGFGTAFPMIEKFGLTKTVKIALVIGLIGTGFRIAFPSQLWSVLIFGSLVTYATIPFMAVGGVLVNNTVEYNEWKFGKRMVGMTNSATSFGSKIGSGLGAALIGWVLAFGNYDGTLAVQGKDAIMSIYALSIYIPGFIILMLFLVMQLYDLDKYYPTIVKELEEREKGNLNGH